MPLGRGGRVYWEFILISIIIIIAGLILWYSNLRPHQISLVEKSPQKIEQTFEIPTSSTGNQNLQQTQISETSTTSTGTQEDLVNDFEQCLARTTSLENIEKLFNEYTDEEFGFSFYYPKNYELEVSTNTITIVPTFYPQKIYIGFGIAKIQIKESNYFFTYYLPAGGPVIIWTSYIFYDKNKCVNYYRDYDLDELDVFDQVVEKEEKNNYQGTKMPPLEHRLKEPDFYTVSGLEVFNLPIRFGHKNIVCLSPNKLLYVSTNPGEVPDYVFDGLTKTIKRIDQEINEKELQKILASIYCYLGKNF